jgi:hypothetical protein
MRNLAATRLVVVFLLLFVAMMHSTVQAQISVGLSQFNPSAECNTLFAASGNGQTAYTTLLNQYGLGFGVPGGAIVISLIALMFSFDVLGLGYVISKLFPATNLSGWLQKEWWELVKSAILIAVVFSVITFISGVGVILYGATGLTSQGSATTGNYVSNIQSMGLNAENYLCTVNDQANYSISQIAPFMFDIGVLQGITVNYGGFPIPPIPIPAAPWIPVFRSGVSVRLFDSLLTTIDIVYLGPTTSIFIDFILYLLVPIKVFYSSQIIILPFLMALGLGVLLPMGLIMRAVPFIRGIGGTLIAFGIGIAVIWPAILILFNAPVSQYFCGAVGTNFCTVVGAVGQTNSQPATWTQSSICQTNMLGSVCDSLSTWINGLSGWGNVIYYFGAAWHSIDSVYPGLNLMIQYNLYLIMQFFVLSVVDLMMFYALTDNLARMLGGTIKISLGRKLKLV